METIVCAIFSPLYELSGLNRLGKTYSASLVRAVAGDFLTDAAVDRIVSRTDGIPLFIEELTKSLVEGGLDIAAIDIPDTLRASLLARIDRLSPRAKEIVQLGSVIGRDIPLDILEAVFQKQNNDFRDGINQLIQSELLYRSGTASKPHYSFKHALVQDSVYGSMLTEMRKAHHLKVANTLLAKFPQTVETAPELVAYHFTEAQSYPSALTYWHRAGKRSASRSADAEAVVQLNRAIEILGLIEQTPALLATKLELHIELSGPLIASGGYSSAEMDRNTQSALQLSEQLGDTSRIFPILYSRLVYHLHTGGVARACELAKDFLDLANRNGDSETIAQGHRLVGFSLLIAGESVDADGHLQIAAEFDAPEIGGLSPSFYGQDIDSTAKVLAAWARLHRGYPEQAVQLFDLALDRATTLDHVNTLGVVLFHGANMFLSMRLENRVGECLSALAAINRNHDLAIWQVAESIVRASVLSLQGNYDKVVAEAEAALAKYSNVLGMQMHMPFILAQIAMAHVEMRNADQAIVSAKQALQISGESGAHIEDAELKRLLARSSYLQHGFCEASEAAYQDALATARNMQLKWYELRVATDFANILNAHACHHRSVEMLQPILDFFTEGDEFPDILDARRALAGSL